MLLECPYCGTLFTPRRRDQIWCCIQHRRKGQDARRMHERYQRALRREAYIMDDPWQRNDLDDMTIEDLFSLGCVDPLPSGYMADDVLGGPMASQPKSPVIKMIQLSLV